MPNSVMWAKTDQLIDRIAVHFADRSRKPASQLIVLGGNAGERSPTEAPVTPAPLISTRRIADHSRFTRKKG
jgi:hypothetical protein